MEKITKPKEKRLSAPLLWTTTFEFVSSYNVDVCLQRFKGIEFQPKNLSSQPSKKVAFQLDEIKDNGGIVYFRGRPSTKEFLFDICIFGQMIQFHNKVQIKSQVGYTRSSVTIFITLLILANTFFVSNKQPLDIHELLFMFLANSMIILIQLAYVRSMKHAILKAINEALTVSKAPRPQTLPP